MKGQRGFSIAETLVALFVVGLALLAAAMFVTSSFHGTKHNSDKEFAIQKAIAIFEELKGVVELQASGAATVLDDYDDGIDTSPVLTSTSSVTDPTDPRSGNLQVDGRWKYERQITVRKFSSLQTNDIRLVNVKVYGWSDGTRSLLAEVGGVIRTLADSFPPTQAYDVYLLAVENVPGWWVYMANLVPFVENAIQDLEARNPGLEFRTHWIRKLTYGRDEQYTPYINAASDSTADIDWVYFYPGRMPSSEAAPAYYVPSHFKARINVDGTLTNGYHATSNPRPYAIADMYNHAMRYPDEVALFAARRALGLESNDTPTLRMLLESMYSDPDKFENAIIINVHGELFPFPPLRNYSDPAKQPDTKPGVRVVAHPEQLRYDNDDDVSLRVYSYLTDPSAAVADQLAEPITVLIRGMPGLTGIRVQAIEGGLDLAPVDGVLDTYYQEEGDTFSDYAGDMYHSVETVTEGTLIKLYNSPVRTPCAGFSCTSGGLATSKRLYDMDYLPTPLSAGAGMGAFSRDLTVAGDMTKNTARWRIIIPDTALPDDTRITFETRIGTDLTTGALYPTANEPSNRSRTYTWRGDDLWIFGDGTAANVPHLPLTERFQILGDPRHSPYADLKASYNSTNLLGTGYNRYFDDFHNASGNYANDANYWPGFNGIKNDGDASNDGWYTGSDTLEIDVNRIYQVFRSALLRSKTIYTTMTGWSYYYVGIGNEIGYDSENGFPNSIPVSRKPFDGTSGTRNEMSITSAESGGVKYIKENDGASAWWGINWLGELYPDSEYTGWTTDGNLPTGTGAGHFVRVLRENITNDLPPGSTFTKALRRTKNPGCTTFFSIGTSTSKFHHQGLSGTGTLQSAGLEIANGFNYPIAGSVNINRPFDTNLNSSGIVPDHYQEATYDTTNLAVTNKVPYFNHSSGSLLGSAMLQFEGTGQDVSWIAVNGISATTLTGSVFIGKWSFLTLIQTFLNAGLPTTAPRVPQLPRVRIVTPNDLTDLDNPSSIDIDWSMAWERWDGQKYTPSYSDSFSESTPVFYSVMYSSNSGSDWKYVQDDAVAFPGVRPTSSSHKVTATNYTWSTPLSSFPRGSYLIRVEAYRDDIALHYSYHQQKVFLKR